MIMNPINEPKIIDNIYDKENGKINLYHPVKKYNASFKFPSGFIYYFPVLYYKGMNYFISSFLNGKIGIFNYNTNFFNYFKFFYNGEEITKQYEPVENTFKNDPNPKINIIDTNNVIKLIRVIFNDNYGNHVEIISNYEERIVDLLKRYLLKFESNIYEITKNDIQFIYNNKIIELGDDYTNNKSTLRNYFKLDKGKENNHIFISVNNKNNILNKRYVTFKDNHGDKVKIFYLKGMSLYFLINKYFSIFEQNELIDRGGEIQFFYNKKIIDINNEVTVELLFQNDAYPLIEVYDPYDLLLIEPNLKYNVTFETSRGFKDNSYFSARNIMKKLLNNYLNYKEIPLNCRNMIQFLYNGEVIDEKRCVIKYFKDKSNPKIAVMDPYGLLNYTINNKPGPKIQVTFKMIGGTIHSILFSYGTTIDKALKKYLWEADLPGDEYNFIYNAYQLKFGNQTPVEKHFKNGTNMVNVYIPNLMGGI